MKRRIRRNKTDVGYYGPDLLRAPRFWIPVVVSLTATPVLLCAGVAPAGAGHGTYFPATLLFPFTMLSTTVIHSITFPFILLAIVQFPAYGIILGFANTKRLILPVASALLAIHALAIGSNYAVVHYALHSPSFQLEQAVRKNDIATVKRMLDKGADPNTHLYSGASLLHLACHQGHLQIVQLLLEKGAEVNYLNPDLLHETALFTAVLHGREDMVQLLLSYGADTGIRNHWGNTALESAKLWREDRIKRSEREKKKYTPEERARDERIISMLDAATKDQKKQ
jgi:hypothetical protein